MKRPLAEEAEVEGGLRAALAGDRDEEALAADGGEGEAGLQWGGHGGADMAVDSIDIRARQTATKA